MNSATMPGSHAQSTENQTTDAYKGAVLIKSLYEMSQTGTGRGAIVATKVIIASNSFKKFDALSPGKQGTVITSIMIKKALAIAGITEPSQGVKCAMAVTGAGATVSLSIARAGDATGISLGIVTIPAAFITAMTLALEAYNVATACFIRDGNVTHKGTSIFDHFFWHVALASA